jgi:hypothetical protein
MWAEDGILILFSVFCDSENPSGNLPGEILRLFSD